MAKSKEETRKYNREYAERNKKKIKDRRVKDYAEKKVGILKQQREAYHKNPEKKIQKVKEYYNRNQPEIYEKEKARKKMSTAL